MVTDKALSLSAEIKDLYARQAPLTEHQAKSKELFDELLAHCDPTAEEFGNVSERAIISGGVLYRLIFDGFAKRRELSEIRN